MELQALHRSWLVNKGKEEEKKNLVPDILLMLLLSIMN